MITKALSIPKDAQLVFDSLDSARNHINLRVGYRLCAHLQVNEQTKFTMPAINGQLPALSPFSGCLAKKLAKVSMKHPEIRIETEETTDIYEFKIR